MPFTIKTGWQGADQAIQVSEAVLPNETAGRFYIRERKSFVRLLTAWKGEEVIGYLIVEFDDTGEYLREVGVRSEFQGQGIGRALVHAYATTTEVQDLWCRPLPHRRDLFMRWGFTREEGGELWGVRSEVVQKTAPQNADV